MKDIFKLDEETIWSLEEMRMNCYIEITSISEEIKILKETRDCIMVVLHTNKDYKNATLTETVNS